MSLAPGPDTPGINERSQFGSLLAILSAACFGTLAILVKLAYREGVTTLQLISIRFLVAAVGLWLVCLMGRRQPWRLPRRTLVILTVMGSTLYSLQAFSYIYAVGQLPASLVSLMLYSYPALVAVGAHFIFGRLLTTRHLAALAVSFLGVALLLGGAPELRFSTALLVAMVAPIVYTLYILAGDTAMPGSDPIAAAAVVMTAAAATFVVVATLAGEFAPPATEAGAGLMLAIGIVPTIAAITLFLAALPRIGGGRLSLLSTFEPLVTVGLAALLFGERLAWPQAIGALFLTGAVIALQVWPARFSSP